MQEFVFGGEVPPKKSLQRIAGNRIRKNERVSEYEEMVADELIAQGAKKIEEPIAVHFTFHVKRDRDIDGSITTLFDAMQYGGLYENDKEICLVKAVKVICGKDEHPHTVVRVGAYGGAPELH